MIIMAHLTCGRREYFERTIASVAENITGPITRTVVFDDSGDPEYRAWLDELAAERGWSVYDWGDNLGFTQAMHRGWMWMERHAVEPYIFWVEEDFVFDRKIDLNDLIAALDASDDLDQIALLRGPCFPKEIAAGGITQQDPEAYTLEQRVGHDVLTHTKYFTTNPALYRRDLTRAGWPTKPSSEVVFTRQRTAAGRRFAYMGDGTPWCTHIGDNRSGVGAY